MAYKMWKWDKRNVGKKMDLTKLNNRELNLMYNVSADQNDVSELKRIKLEYERRRKEMRDSYD